MPIQRLNPDNVYQLKGLSSTVRVGNMVYISGQVSLDENRNFVGEGDPEAQVTQIYENLENHCKAHGGTLANMVKTTTYITDIAYYPTISKAREEWYGDTPPANTTVVISGLARPEMLIEIEAIACIE